MQALTDFSMNEQGKDPAYLNRIAETHALIQMRKGAEAIEMAEALMREAPDQPYPYFLLGLYAFSKSDFGNAIELFNSAHDRDPECREYADCLAILYTVIGKLSEGLYFAKLSTALESDPTIRPFIPTQLSNYFQALDRIEPSQHYVNAMLLHNVGKYADAVQSCELELKQNDKHEQCYALLGKCHLRLGNYEKAESALHAAVHLNPGDAENVGLLGSVLCHLGRFDEAMVCHSLALERQPEAIDQVTAALLDAEFLSDSLAPIRNRLRKDLKRRIAAQPKSELDVKRERAKKDRIRVGYVSNALYDTEQGRFILALLASHDHRRFEIYCYQQSIAKDPVHIELQNTAEAWREIFDVQDPVMDLIINADDIDVLVDLCGYTAGNRAGLLATRPAPVQIGLLEPPYGIGVPGIDFVVSDAVTHARDTAAAGKQQGVARLECGLLALQPFTFYPDVDDLPARAQGRLTFGGQCDLARLTPETAANWSRVLAASGRAKLLLGDGGEISDTVKNHVVDLFGHFGAADRIMFWEQQPDDHLKIGFFRQIDVLLDTYPVSGRLDICKALWMGVPVITLDGPRRISQTAASILHSAGQEAWICDSVDAMAELAASFAEDLDGLAKTRRGLRDQVAASDLFSPRKLAAALESVYAAAIEMQRRRGAKPATKRGAKRGAKAPAPARKRRPNAPRPRKIKKTAGKKAAGKARRRTKKTKGRANKAKRRK